MPTLTLTDRFIATLGAPTTRVEYHDTVARGLVLRVTPTGAKSWALRYRLPQSRRTFRLTLGTYPDVTLKRARKRADSERGNVADGVNPAAQKRLKRETAERAAENTVAALAKKYIEKYAKRHKRSWQEDDRILTADVLPYWRTREVTEIRRRDVRDLLDRIIERGSPIAANRCLAVVRKMFNFALQEDWIDASPATLIPKPGTEQERTRTLSDDEIRLIWQGCDTLRPALAVITRLRLLTAQRGRELASIRWTDIDGEWLTLPATITKNKRDHRVYLTEEARALLALMPRVHECEWVFPGQGVEHLKPLTDEKKVAGYLRAWMLGVCRAEGRTPPPTDFTLHDLRRSAASRMGAAGIPRAHIAYVLNHVDGTPRATKIYDRYERDNEKKVALETWGRVLRRILDETTTPAVPLPFARA